MKEFVTPSPSAKRPYRLTWINPRTGLQCRLYYASLEGAKKRVHQLVEKDVPYAEIWHRVYSDGTAYVRVYSYVDLTAMHEEGEVAV